MLTEIPTVRVIKNNGLEITSIVISVLALLFTLVQIVLNDSNKRSFLLFVMGKIKNLLVYTKDQEEKIGEFKNILCSEEHGGVPTLFDENLKCEGMTLFEAKQFNKLVKEIYGNVIKMTVSNKNKKIYVNQVFRWWFYINKIYKKLKALRKSLENKPFWSFEVHTNELVKPNDTNVQEYGGLNYDEDFYFKDYFYVDELTKSTIKKMNFMWDKTVHHGNEILKSVDFENLGIAIYCPQYEKIIVLSAKESKEMWELKFLLQKTPLNSDNKSYKENYVTLRGLVGFAEFKFWSGKEYVSLYKLRCSRHKLDTLLVTDNFNKNGHRVLNINHEIKGDINCKEFLDLSVKEESIDKEVLGMDDVILNINNMPYIVGYVDNDEAYTPSKRTYKRLVNSFNNENIDELKAMMEQKWTMYGKSSAYELDSEKNYIIAILDYLKESVPIETQSKDDE